MSAQLKHIYTQKPTQPIRQRKVCYLMFRVIYSWDSIVFQVWCYAFFKLRVFEQAINIINVFFQLVKVIYSQYRILFYIFQGL